MGTSTGLESLVDELVRLGGLLGDGADGVLEDLTLSAGHAEMLEVVDDLSPLDL